MEICVEKMMCCQSFPNVFPSQTPSLRLQDGSQPLSVFGKWSHSAQKIQFRFVSQFYFLGHG